MPEIETLIWLIPALPLAAFVLVGLVGCRLRSLSHWPVVLAVAASCVLSVLLLVRVYAQVQHAHDPADDSVGHSAGRAAGEPLGFERTVTLWNWAVVPAAMTPSRMSAGRPLIDDLAHGRTVVTRDLNIDVTLRADPLTSIMLVLVTFVGSLVVIYSIGYMHGDPGYARFFAYLALFIFSMTMLVVSSNFLLLYVFWEAVGVSSYLLIGFWFQKPEASAAGMKAFLVNRVGDVGLALAIFVIWLNFGTLNFHDVASADDPQVVAVEGVLGQSRLARPGAYHVGGEGVAMALALLLMLAACGKSAQFPLHVWLPDAMEGPTPVSALIHAATMVTAGVYLVTRCAPLFLATPTGLYTVAAIGAFTALLAGLIAVTQTDLKRVLAYSTVSQLGFMFLGLGTGTLAGFVGGMFHLFTHGFFKALLFLGAGSVMHAMGGVIDMRRFGGLRSLMPVTHWTFLAGALALAGMAPLSGFWSKDEILTAVALMDRLQLDPLAVELYRMLYLAALLTACLTAFYTFRAYFLTFHGQQRVPPEAGHHAHESPASMTIPLVILAVGACSIGGLLLEPFGEFLAATPSLQFAGFQALNPQQAEVAHGVHLEVAATSIVLAAVGIALAWFLYCGSTQEVALLTRLLRPLYAASQGKFFLDEIYYCLCVWPLQVLAAAAAWFDQYILDGLVDLVGAIPPRLAGLFRWTGSGLVPYYALGMALGLLGLMGVLLAGN